MRILAAVLFLIAVEGGILWYFARSLEIRAVWTRATLSDPPQRRAVSTHASRPAVAHIDLLVPATQAAEIQARSTRVGFPFQLSASVEEDCRRTATFSCRWLHDFLDDLAEEWRDADWAAEIEERLEKTLTRGERGKYEIRALECRNTRCAVEVASKATYTSVSLVSDDFLDRELRWYGASTTAWEDDAETGIPIIVTVATWEKRMTPVPSTHDD